MEWEERRGDVTEMGEGVCCEVTGEVPEEESERGLSEARGTFLKQEENPLNETCTSRNSCFFASSKYRFRALKVKC